MSNLSNNLSRVQILDILSTLQTQEADCVANVLTATQALKNATRRSITTPGDDSELVAARAAVADAKLARTEAAQMLSEAVRLHDEIVISEREAAQDVVRVKIRALASGMLTAARAADSALATYAGYINEARRIEHDAMRLSEGGLGVPFAGSMTSAALGECSRYVASLGNESPEPIQGFAESHARRAAKQFADMCRL